MSLNPMNEDATSQKIRNSQLKNLGKHDVLELNVCWFSMVAPLKQSRSECIARALHKVWISFGEPPGIVLLSSLAKRCDALLKLNALPLNAGGTDRAIVPSDSWKPDDMLQVSR
jgi:hypothetical protein